MHIYSVGNGIGDLSSNPRQGCVHFLLFLLMLLGDMNPSVPPPLNMGK